MGMDLKLNEQFLYSTVRIECLLANGKSSTGTGFFFEFFHDSEDKVTIPVIVTNKHVVDGATEGRFLLTLADEKIKPSIERRFIKYENIRGDILFHPDSDTDICIIPIAGVLQALREEGKTPFCIYLTSELIPDKKQLASLTAIEDIIMVGYPNGIWDEVNNRPIVRKGITATHPKVNYNGKAEFMIDAACFPGSSGSPVFIYNEGSYSTGQGIAIGNRVMFLGVLYAGPMFTATGDVQVVKVPTAQNEVVLSNTSIPNNLGFVIRSEKLLDFIPILKRYR